MNEEETNSSELNEEIGLSKYTKFVSEIQSLSLSSIDLVLNELSDDDAELMKIYFGLTDTTEPEFQSLLQRLKLNNRGGVSDHIILLKAKLKTRAHEITRPEPGGRFNPFN